MAVFGFFKKDKSKASVASSSSVAADDDASSNGNSLRPRRSLALLSPGNLNDAYASSATSLVSATSAKKPRRLPFTKKTPLANEPPKSTLGDHGKSVDTHLSPPKKLTLNLDSSASSLPTHSPVFPSFHHTGSSHTLSIPSPMNVQTPSRPQARPMQAKDSPSSQKSNGGLFGWRDRKRSKPSIPDEALTIPPLFDDSSFNLKSFRHVLPERTTDSPPPGNSPTQSLSKSSLAPPARPRGSSVASADSAQRISVAAFREAQARRSSTNLTSGSPSPTIRPLSVATTSSVSDFALSRQANPPARAKTPTMSPSPAPRPISTFKNGPSSGAVGSSATSSSEDSDSEERSPSRSCSRLSRQRTITKSYRVKSDLGHERGGAEHSHRRQGSSQSELGHGLPSPPSRANPPSHSPARGPPPSSFQKTAEAVLGTRSHNLYKQQRGSHSAHELNPTSAAQRASTMQKLTNSGNPPKSPAADSDTSESSSESESSDDDAPLASLAQTRRPPSAMSNATTTTTNATSRKPLINLNIGNNPITGRPLIAEKENTEPARIALISPTNINSRLSRLTAAAGLGVHGSSVASKSVENISNTSHLRPSFIDRSQPISPSSTDTVTPPVRTASPEPIEQVQSSRRASMPPVITLQEVERSKSGEVQPVPVPVRSREHQSGFRVVSRPLKPASGSPPPSSPASAPTQSHHLQRPPLGARSTTSPSQSISAPRPQSSMPPLKTQPLILPSKDSSSLASSSASRQSVMASNGGARPGVQNAPPRPLLMETRRRDSPASSTGGSSTGPAPLTPADGSDYFSPGVRGTGDSPDSNSNRSTPQSAMKGGRGHLKRASVSFQDNMPELDHDATVRGRSSSHSLAKSDDMSVEERETRRRERRRGEAKAAIELGNVVNGKGPQVADDDDDDEDFLPNSSPQTAMQSNGSGYFGQMPMSWPAQAMPQQPMMTGISNPSMSMMGAPVMGMNMNMMSPQPFMFTPPPPNADPAYLAAHQQAMFVAKQAYQYAVAQQAMQAAGEEWERGSSVGAFAPSSTMGASGGMPGFAMNPMWNSSTPMFSPAPRSMYAGSIYGAPSEANWGTASVYGESFGPANQRASRISAHKRNSSGGALVGMAVPNGNNTFSRGDTAGNGAQMTFQSPATARSGPRPRVKTAPSNSNLPPQHRNSQIPPSSWKVGS